MAGWYTVVLPMTLVSILVGPRAALAISDEEVRLIREVQETRYIIEQTEWTWFNRNEKSGQEKRLGLLERILDHVQQRKVAIAPGPFRQVPPARQQPTRELSDEEVRLIREIEELRYDLETTEWTWDNRNQKTAAEKRLQFLESLLARISP